MEPIHIVPLDDLREHLDDGAPPGMSEQEFNDIFTHICDAARGDLAVEKLKSDIERTQRRIVQLIKARDDMKARLRALEEHHDQ